MLKDFFDDCDTTADVMDKVMRFTLFGVVLSLGLSISITSFALTFFMVRLLLR